jgi:hypothetical protein
MSTVKDQFSKGEWEALLDDAEHEASDDWAQNFVADLRDKYDKYGAGMFVSNRQIEILEQIASGERKSREW